LLLLVAELAAILGIDLAQKGSHCLALLVSCSRWTQLERLARLLGLQVGRDQLENVWTVFMNERRALEQKAKF
jgi:hypothetical protein